MKNEIQYNQTITVATLTRDKVINPQDLRLMRYSKLDETHEGIPTGKLGNQAGGFPFELNGKMWKGTEYLYLCGKWSWEGDEARTIQEDVRSAASNYAAKRFKDNKYRRRTRADWETIRVPYMLWCVWRKCLGNSDYRALLLSLPEDRVVVEVISRDPFWAAVEGEDGIIRGKNIMGKIITICRRCLQQGTTPEIDTDLLNQAGIYLLGERVEF